MGRWETIDRPGYLGPAYRTYVEKWTAGEIAGKPQVWRHAWKFGDQELEFDQVQDLLRQSYYSFLKSQKRFLDSVLQNKPPMLEYHGTPLHYCLNIFKDYLEEYLENYFIEELENAVMLCGARLKHNAPETFEFMVEDKDTHVAKLVGKDVHLHPANLPFFAPRLIVDDKPKHYGGAVNRQEGGLPSMMPGSFMHFFYHNRTVQVLKDELGTKPK